MGPTPRSIVPGPWGSRHSAGASGLPASVEAALQEIDPLALLLRPPFRQQGPVETLLNPVPPSLRGKPRQDPYAAPPAEPRNRTATPARKLPTDALDPSYGGKAPGYDPSRVREFLGDWVGPIVGIPPTADWYLRHRKELGPFLARLPKNLTIYALPILALAALMSGFGNSMGPGPGQDPMGP